MTSRSVSPVRAGQVPFELKGSLFTLTVIQLWQSDLDTIEQHLKAKIEQAPGFFQNVPVVLDLAEIDPASRPDFVALGGLLRRHGLVPVGIRNAGPPLQDSAVQAGLPVLRDGRNVAPARASEPEPTPRTSNRLHLQPVRSGQQIYAADGDLIVIGAVSVGAEVLADGNIHIYGPLRGRALAGVRGDTRARIFCHSLEAQLVSIAGHYRVLEEPDETDKNQAMQVHLADERLIIEPLAR